MYLYPYLGLHNDVFIFCMAKKLIFFSVKNLPPKINVCLFCTTFSSAIVNPPGLPMRVGKNKHAIFSFLIDRVEQKLQPWGVLNISKAGKVTQLKKIAQSIPDFWMGLLLIPAERCDKLEKHMNAYCGGGGGEKRVLG